MELSYLRTLIRSLNSLLHDPLPLSRRWHAEVKEYFEKVTEEYEKQFSDEKEIRNCIRPRKEDFMCPFVEISPTDCWCCKIPERTIKTYCFRTKTNICPYERVSKFACHQCKLPNSFRDSELDEIIKEIREEIQKDKSCIRDYCPKNKNIKCKYINTHYCVDCIRKTREKEMSEINPGRVCPFTRNTVCYNGKTACETCTIRKEKEMSECETVRMKCFHTNKDDRFFWSKDGTGKYLKYKKYWGGIITNKPSRTKEKYASRISIDGTRMSNINEEDFKKIFAPMCEHIYEDKCGHRQEIKLTPEMCDDIFKNMLTNDCRLKTIFRSLTSKECETLLNELIGSSKIHEKYFIKRVSLDVQNLNDEPLIIIKKK